LSRNDLGGRSLGFFAFVILPGELRVMPESSFLVPDIHGGTEGIFIRTLNDSIYNISAAAETVENHSKPERKTDTMVRNYTLKETAVQYRVEKSSQRRGTQSFFYLYIDGEEVL